MPLCVAGSLSESRSRTNMPTGRWALSRWECLRGALGLSALLLLCAVTSGVSAQAVPGSGLSSENGAPSGTGDSSGIGAPSGADASSENGASEERPREFGLSIVRPVWRFSFGTVTSLSGDGTVFAFDAHGGAEFQFFPGHPRFTIPLEFGYTRRGGGVDTHGFLVSTGIGFTTKHVQGALLESLTVDFRGAGLGLRTTLRISTLLSIVGLELGYEASLRNSDARELRIQAFIDVGWLAGMLGFVAHVVP